MAVLAGSSFAKAEGASGQADNSTNLDNSAVASKGSSRKHAQACQEVRNAGTSSESVITKDIGHAASIDAKPSFGTKHGPRDFVDPRLERLHFLQAVQRMRAQVADPQDVDGDVLAQKVGADLMSLTRQRPKSAVARLHASGEEVAPKTTVDIATDRYGWPKKQAPCNTLV